MPLTLLGAPDSLATKSIEAREFPGRSGTANARRAFLEGAYQSIGASPLQGAAESAFSSMDLFDVVNYAGYVEAQGVVYPDSAIAQGLRQVAALLKSGMGFESVKLNHGGWDHHAGLQNKFAKNLTDLSLALEAFYLDMAQSGVDYVLLTQTEFGRRVAPNASDGTDHGYASAMFVMGPRVQGGRVIADWPGLSDAELVSGDLKVTIDWRDIAAEVLTAGAGSTDIAAVFPGFSPTVRGVF